MTPDSLSSYVYSYFERLKQIIDLMPVDRIEAIGDLLYQAYKHGKHVFIVGNGGSAATSSHMACDLAKNTIGPPLRRFRVVSLNDNMPLLSAIANDLGYERVFAEQLINLIRPGDVLIVLSGSGSSPNIVEAIRYARSRSATVIALLGFDGGEALELADEAVVVPSDDYGPIEDMHMILDHVLTGYFRIRLDREELVAT